MERTSKCRQEVAAEAKMGAAKCAEKKRMFEQCTAAADLAVAEAAEAAGRARQTAEDLLAIQKQAEEEIGLCRAANERAERAAAILAKHRAAAANAVHRPKVPGN